MEKEGKFRIKGWFDTGTSRSLVSEKTRPYFSCRENDSDSDVKISDFSLVAQNNTCFYI